MVRESSASRSPVACGKSCTCGQFEITVLINAPFLNSFGSTETGIVPASGSQLPPGVLPTSFRKLPTSFSDIRIVNDKDEDVGPGVVGELCVRIATPAVLAAMGLSPMA